MIAQPRTHDYSVLSPAQQREVLELSARLVERLAKSYARRFRQAAPHRAPILDVEDIQTEGQLYALEAAIEYDPTRGASLKTHVHNRVVWRLADFARKAIALLREEGAGVSYDAQSNRMDDYAVGSLHPRVVTHEECIDSRALTPEQLVAREEAKDWVLRTLRARVTPREAIIVSQRLAGVDGTDAELAEAFGVDRSQVCRATASAVEKLARAARPRGVAVCG